MAYITENAKAVCRKKMRFPTEDIAKTRAKHLKKSKYKKKYYPYKCYVCDMWHLTTRKPKRKKSGV